MSKKRRLNLRIHEDEMALVGPIERFYHLAEVYEGLADMYPEAEQGWLEMADWVKEWIARTAKVEDDEWENMSSSI